MVGDDWQGGGRPDFANMTDEQRERFRTMRQQRQAEGSEADEVPSRPTPQEPPAQQPEESEVAEAKAETDEEDWGGLFGGFFEETPAEEAPTQAPTRRN